MATVRGDDGLLGSYRLPLSPWRLARDEDAAARAAAELGGHIGAVVLKAQVPDVVHKTDAALQPDLRGEDDVRRAYRASLADRLGERLDGVAVQPMAADGVEVLIGTTQEPMFGPLVVFGLGGVTTDVLGDHAARLTPLTDRDAAELIRSVRAAPLLLGHRGSPPVNLAALEDAVLRVGRLAGDLPELAELDLNPITARPDGVLAVDALVRIAPREALDPYLRRLR